MQVFHSRLLALVLLAFSALFLPFWVTVAIFILGTLFFENFYIGIFVLFFMDAVYVLEGVKIGPFWGIITISGIICFLIIKILKDKFLNLH